MPSFPPDTDLPRIPGELGTPEEFLEQVKEGYLDVYLRCRDRSKQEILIYSTGLREHEESAPDEEELLDPEGEPKGHWKGLKFIPDPPSNDS